MKMLVFSDEKAVMIPLEKSIKEVLEELNKLSNPQVVDYMR